MFRFVTFLMSLFNIYRYAYCETGEGLKLALITSRHYHRLPDGTALIGIDGSQVHKGLHEIDMDTRQGFMAFGLPARKKSAFYWGRYRTQ